MRRSPKFDSVRHSIDLLQQRSKEEQREIIRRMSPMDALKFDADFETWAHEGQLPPKGEGWRVWLMMAGRGFGKTRAGAEWIHRLATRRSGLRIALVGANINETRRVMIEGVSGLLTIARRERRRVDWEPALGRFRWRNGSQAQLFSGDNADGLRGPEHDFAWADELAKWREAEEAWMNLQFGLRRGERPRALITTTPRPIEILTRMMEDKWTVTTRGRVGRGPTAVEALPPRKDQKARRSADRRPAAAGVRAERAARPGLRWHPVRRPRPHEGFRPRSSMHRR
ncbi:MAG TPA: terminase family protein [Sphingomicrobium sp.]|nr:terminase family protein [Sphingomicrobium sp.]